MAHKASFRELFRELIQCLSDLGWCIAIPDIEDHEEFPGMIVGSPEYVDRILSHIPDGKKYDVYKRGY